MAKNRVIRGDIVIVFPAEYGKCGHELDIKNGRPGVIVSGEGINKSGVYEIAFLTSKPKKPSLTHIPITSAKTHGYVICEQINTVDKRRIGATIGHCSAAEVRMIDLALATSLGINSKYADKLTANGGVPKNEFPDFTFGKKLAAMQEELERVKQDRDMFRQLYMDIYEKYRTEEGINDVEQERVFQGQ